ncbi:MAG: Sec-independent protein translocase protein TatB [Pseudomonadota bacterium]
MFDIGWIELFLVAIVALVVVGPEDFPKMMHTVGQGLGKARGMWRDVQSAFDQLARESELDDLRKQFINDPLKDDPTATHGSKSPNGADINAVVEAGRPAKSKPNEEPVGDASDGDTVGASIER